MDIERDVQMAYYQEISVHSLGFVRILPRNGLIKG